MKRVLIVLGLLVVLAMGGLVGAWFYFDGLYGISRAPRLTYADIFGQQFPLRLVIQPPKARDIILEHLAQSGQEVPEFALNRVLPQEIAIISAVDPANSDLDIEVFVNEQSFGPVMHQYMNQTLQTMPASNVEWAVEGVEFPRRGVLSLEGNLPVEPGILTTTSEQFGAARPRPPLPMEGDHFIEALIDNRNGEAFTLVQILMGDQLPDTSIPDEQKTTQQRMAEAQMTFVTNSLKMTRNIHVIAEPGAGDVLDITLTVVCNEEAGRSGPETVKTVLDMGLNQGAPVVKSEYGYDLTGETRMDGQSVVGEYKFGPLSKIMANLMQPANPPANNAAAAEPAPAE